MRSACEAAPKRSFASSTAGLPSSRHRPGRWIAGSRRIRLPSCSSATAASTNGHRSPEARWWPGVANPGWASSSGVSCGSPDGVMPACPRCSFENPEGFKFCGHCGAPLTPAVASAEVRKRISVVFCDLVGSTPLGERLDPESFRRVMTRYYDTMRTVLERHDGSVGKFEGDAIMALFGVPKLAEDDALRAVRAAAEMSNTMAALSQDWEREWGVQLACRIGVNTGYVLTGDDLSAQHLVVGDALNTAARLEQAAGAGEVLLSEATHALVQHAVEVEEVPSLPLRGKTGDVCAFRLLSVNPWAPARASRRDSPMVGRDVEFARLRDEFESTLADRTCRLVTVGGPAGMGKTRLVEEFAAALGVSAIVLTGRCLSYGQGVTFWAATDAIKQAADIGPGDDHHQARTNILAFPAGHPA